MRLPMILLLVLAAVRDVANAQTKPTAAAANARAIKRATEARRRHVDFVEAAQLKTQNQWLIKHRSVGMPLLTSRDMQTQYILLRRTESSEPEVHARWDDLVLVRAGTGAIAVGDSLIGSKYRAPGERAGGTIVNASQLVVRAGDIVRIPAAVPHAFIVAGVEPLEYVVIKQRRQDLPIRWFGDP